MTAFAQCPPATPTSTTTASYCSTPNGSITITSIPAAQQSLYQFSIDGGATYQNSPTFLNLAAGNYQTRVKHIAQGCQSAIVTRPVGQTAAPASTLITSSSANVTSCTAPDGKITFSAPLAGYDYSVDGGATFQASPAFTGLAVGTYKLVIRSTVTGCASLTTTAASRTLTLIGAPSSHTTTSTPTYCTTNNGSITFSNTAPKARTSYEFSIDGGASYQSSFTFLNLAAGTYSTRIRDIATGCESTTLSRAVSLTAAPASTTIAVNSANVTSCTAPDGKITFSAPLVGYDYSVDGGATFQASPAFTGLAVGTYKLVIRSTVTGCASLTTAAASRTLTLINAPSSHTTTSTATYCTTNNGSITFSNTAPKARTSYEFSIDGGASYQSSFTFLNLAAGTYSTRIRDIATGCESTTLSRAVSLTAAPVSTTIASSSANVTSCQDPNGSITFTAPLAGYDYSVDGGATFQASRIFTGLAVGTYKLVIRSTVTGCASLTTAAASRTLTLINAPTSHTTTSTPTYCTTDNGSITFSNTAPKARTSYEFSIDGGASYQSSFTFLNLAAGTYRTRIRDIATGCESTTLSRAVSLTAAPVSTTIASTTTAVTNCTAVNGGITFTAPLSGFEYSVDGGATFQASRIFTGLAAGSYKLVIRSTVTGCASLTTAAATRTLVISGAPAAPTGTATTSSCTLATGTINFSTPTPTTNFLYSVNGGTTFGGANQVSFDSLSPGVYTTVAQSRTTGCISATRAITVQPALTVSTPAATLFRPTDCNNPNGSITFTSPASSPPANIYAYSIDGGETFGDAASTVYGGLLPGVYQLQAIQLNTGCVSAVNSVTLVENPAVGNPVSTVANMSECNPTGGAITFTSPAPLTNYQFSIDGGQTFGPANQFTFSNLTVGTYQTLARLISSGCASDTVVKVLSYNLAAVSLTVTAQNQDPCLTTNGSVSIAASGGTGVYEYSLNGGQTYANLTSNPLVVNNLSTGNYIVVVRDKANIVCIDQEVVSLEAANCPVPIPLVRD
ncbi:hypothetical protein GCM10028819_31500 [Spirosoma humi]